MLNILAIGQYPPHPGGAAISLCKLLEGLAGLGHAIRVVAPVALDDCTHSPAVSNNEYSTTVYRYPVPYFQLMAKITDKDDYFDLEKKAISEILHKLILESRPDIILIGRETFVLSVKEIAEHYNIPFILRAAGATTIGINQNRFSKELTEKLLNGYAGARIIVTPAKHMAKRLNKLGFSNVEVIPNAVDHEIFHSAPRDPVLAAKFGILPDDIVVSHISNFAEMKRPLDLIHALPAAIRSNPKIRGLMIGKGELSNATAKLISKLKIDSRVTMTGWIEYAELADHLRLSDLVVMPASDETQARVYVETLSTGRVLVASDIDAATEVIVDRKNGFLFEMGNIKALSSIITKLAGDANIRKIIGAEAAATSTQHQLQQAVISYNELLQRVANPN